MREAALDKKGEDFRAIDLEGKTIIADTFAIVTGRSKIQTRSIADAISEALKASGHHLARTEGYNDGNWILLDAGSVIVHVFTPEQREFYNLERLWAGADERKVHSS
ncbi:MAG: ribosome silencing factor [Candidatus Eremiobacteraeota bacterium]|nr:ribosome silencing factor [Candidatus Eremiobacteraeota bacterium]